MKIVHALVGFEKASGISLFVSELLRRQVGAGNECVFAYQRRFEHYLDEKVAALKCSGNLAPLTFKPDIVHLHALWSMFSIRVMRWCIRDHIPYIISPHGCLMPNVMERGRLKKQLFFYLLIKPLMHGAAVLHVTAHAEADAIRKLGFKQDVEIIPLGMKMPCPGKKNKTGDKIMLFVGRVSREKGLDNLLKAWQMVKRDGWRLVIAGPDWKGYRSTLDSEVKNLGIRDNVEFQDCVVGEAKDALYRSADCFVLPSPMENFSAVVLEALSHGLPTIATKGTPWRELDSEKCGWWIDQGVIPLAAALADAMGKDDSERVVMGERGKTLVSSKYSWESVSSKLLDVYRKVAMV